MFVVRVKIITFCYREDNIMQVIKSTDPVPFGINGKFGNQRLETPPMALMQPVTSFRVLASALRGPLCVKLTSFETMTCSMGSTSALCKYFAILHVAVSDVEAYNGCLMVESAVLPPEYLRQYWKKLQFKKSSWAGVFVHSV